MIPSNTSLLPLAKLIDGTSPIENVVAAIPIYLEIPLAIIADKKHGTMAA